MRTGLIVVVISILSLSALVGLSYGFGWIGVHQTKTIGKAQKNADREVFEESQSYVEGKRQEAQKLYKEYLQADNEEDKATIEQIVSMSFANFDESKLSPVLKSFVYNCKY